MLIDTLTIHFGICDFIQDPIEIRTLFNGLNHSYFLEQIPKFLNHRETVSNINLLKACIMIHTKRWMEMKDMRCAITAFSSVAKENNV